MTGSRAGLASPGLADGFPAARVAVASLKAGDTPRLDGEDLEHIKALAEVRDWWPPILVHRQTMCVIDGMHRLRAARLRGLTMVEVRFFDGDEDEAFVAGVKANVAHGLPLTLADRKAAATRIIGSQPQRSDRWIGEVTGLAAGTVGAIRRRVSPSVRRDAARIGRDGRVRPLEMAEGRRRAQEEISSRPEASLREIAKVAGVSPATVKDVRDRMHSGEDPVRRNQHATRAGQPGYGTRPGSDHDEGEAPSEARDLAWSLRQLRKDPSLRYTEPGRALLRWLEAHACGPRPVAGLIDTLPSHCGYLIANIARECAREWQELAASLEQRLKAGHIGSREGGAVVSGLTPRQRALQEDPLEPTRQPGAGTRPGPSQDRKSSVIRKLAIRPPPDTPGRHHHTQAVPEPFSSRQQPTRIRNRRQLIK